MSKRILKKLVAVTPAHNEEEHIEGCVKSVLDQWYPVTLHVVVDDNSSDGTSEIVTSFPYERVNLVRSGLTGSKLRGLRPHLVQQIGVDKVTEKVPDWEYLLLLDGDCWIPPTYCEKIISEMDRDQDLAMAGARLLHTPRAIERGSSIHVRSSNHIIRRTFYDRCCRRGVDYANYHGEIFLERLARIYHMKTRTFPISAYENRETGTVTENPYGRGHDEFCLGTPLLFLLMILGRHLSRENILEICGWIRAWLYLRSGEEIYFCQRVNGSEKIKKLKKIFTRKERALLRTWYFNYALRCFTSKLWSV